MNLSYPNKRVALRAAEAMGKKHGVHFSVYNVHGATDGIYIIAMRVSKH